MNSITVFAYVILIAFIIRTLRNTLYQTFLWQLKEYRVDRMIAHLKTLQGKRLMFGPITIIKWMLLFLFICFLLLRNWGYLVLGLIGVIWVAEAILNLRELFSRGWKVPKFTIKILFILLIIATVIIVFLALFFRDDSIFVRSSIADKLYGWLLVTVFFSPFIDKLLAPSIALLMISFNIPSWIYKKWIIERAKKKMGEIRGRGKIRVIGITGSYGKTSTKEFLATILAHKYNVAKTPASQNTDIGNAKYILNELKDNTQVFVVEIGAYKKGEIKAVSDIVHPDIGVITGIDEQHLELFGSIEQTMKAKYELIESLPPAGLAVCNAGNQYALELARRTKKKTLLYQFTDGQREQGVSVWAEKTKLNKDSIEFSLHVGNEVVECSSPLIGKQHIENILAAVTVANELGLSVGEIKKAISLLKSPAMTMNLIKHASGAYLIDDTFNTNPAGVSAALDYLEVVKGKKILVLNPIIELGSKSEQIHKTLGRRAATICDKIILTNKNFNQAFLAEVNEFNGGEKKVFSASGVAAAELLKPELLPSSIMIFEGKEAGKILNSLL